MTSKPRRGYSAGTMLARLCEPGQQATGSAGATSQRPAEPAGRQAAGQQAAAGLQARPRAKKSWGQHFLRDSSVLAAIVAAGGDLAGRVVLELGAGTGALTEPLLRAKAHVIAIERDRDLVPLLHALAARYPGQLVVEAADAQQVDYAAYAERAGGPLTVFGNLPYQLSSRILVNLAAAGPAVGSATVLVQKEVAERLAAQPPGRTYGLLSVLVQRRFLATLGRRVPPGAFRPAPRVDSAIVHLSQRQALSWLLPASEGGAAADLQEAWLGQAARAAFSARRKTLRNSLMAALNRPAEAILAALASSGLSPTARAETLTVDQFAALGRALFAGGQHGPSLQPA